MTMNNKYLYLKHFSLERKYAPFTLEIKRFEFSIRGLNTNVSASHKTRIIINFTDFHHVY